MAILHLLSSQTSCLSPLYQVMKTKAIKREYLLLPPIKLSTISDFTSCIFSKDKELGVVSQEYLALCAPSSLTPQPFMCSSYNCFFSLIINYSLYFHQHTPEVLKISPFMLSSVFHRFLKPKQIFHHFFYQVVQSGRVSQYFYLKNIVCTP